ncbi:galactokinase [Armatimonadetes bacterium Uphvl-Ar2]|nr:galactokinase [Armatimonadetes bacterium Uphvl-Ar2]
MQSEWACAVFEDTFGKPAELVIEAPGRVNLIGEHTDYSDGFVMPAALPYGVSLAARATDGPSRLYSVARGWAKPFQVAEVQPGSTRGWANYAAGMAWALRQAGMPVDTNAEVVVANDLPIGAGVSSSAAMEVAFGWLWLNLACLPIDPLQVARIAQMCENQYVGVNCGLMDMAASALGVDGHALLMDIRTMEVQPVPVPDDLVLMLCDTGRRRGLAGSAYNDRRDSVERAAATLGVSHLRDVTAEQLEAQAASLNEEDLRRAQHVVAENARVHQMAAALRADDRDQMGALMQASHESLRDLFEVSCEELDAMAEIARAAPGCVGARMTGAGFGGACVALVTEQDVPNYVERVSEAYGERFPDRESVFLAARASRGTCVGHDFR